jgi:hypothetical protein
MALAEEKSGAEGCQQSIDQVAASVWPYNRRLQEAAVTELPRQRPGLGVAPFPDNCRHGSSGTPS